MDGWIDSSARNRTVHVMELDWQQRCFPVASVVVVDTLS